MSLGWTAIQAQAAPPSAVLAFYPPTDYESGHWWNSIDDSTRNLEPTMSMDEIIGQLRKPRKPLQEYHVAGRDMEHTEEGWVSLGDPRSELVLHSVRDGLTIPLLLHGPRWGSEQQQRVIIHAIQRRAGGDFSSPSCANRHLPDPDLPHPRHWRQARPGRNVRGAA